MKYKSHALNKIEILSGTIQKIDIAANQGDKTQLYKISEVLKEQLEDIRQMIEIEADDFPAQFK